MKNGHIGSIVACVMMAHPFVTARMLRIHRRPQISEGYIVRIAHIVIGGGR
jgi:hypothetical protein